MPDTSNAWMAIGGRIETREAFEGLLGAFESDGAGIEWLGPPECGWQAHVLACAKEGKPIELASNQAGGTFATTEGVATDLRLHWHRADDGHYTWEPGNAVFNPATGLGEVNLAGNIDGGPAVRLHELAEWQDASVLSGKITLLREHCTRPGPIVLAEALLAELEAEAAA